MKFPRQLKRLYLIGLLLTLPVFLVVPALAQQLEIPQTQTQGQPSIRYRPTPSPPPPSSTVETIPSRQTPPPPPVVPPTPPPITYQTNPSPPPQVYRPLPEFHQPQPVLPAVFRGCWRGKVSLLDRIERLPGAPPIGPWTPKTYWLCYKRVGNGPFELTFTDAGIQQSRKITNAEGRMRLLSTNGQSYATMIAYLHFDEFRTHASFFESSTFPVDEETDLQCEIEPDGMHVRGTVYGRREGKPWFRAWWHATFAHTSGIPE